ncbi:MAG: hypothetical protein KAR87_02595 [Candidatus Aenigmarchaeota archaeon]|nr:hypothetical protein [Candidatus Aenigmarchaeota archaeon]
MKKFIIALLLISSILISGCSNSKIITQDIEISGKIYGNLCNGAGKCIESLVIFPQGFNFDYSDWNKVKPYFNKTVKIKGDLISEVDIYSCEEDYFDGSQHPVNEKCDIPGMKYYTTNTYLKIDSIELIE